MSNNTQHGYYFSFERGYWVKDEHTTRRFSTSGVTYIGSLTREQQVELDSIITKYVNECFEVNKRG